MSEAPQLPEDRIWELAKQHRLGAWDRGEEDWIGFARAIEAEARALATLPVVPPSALLAEAADCLEWHYRHKTDEDYTGFQQKQCARLARKLRALTLPVGDVEPRSSLGHETERVGEAVQRPAISGPVLVERLCSGLHRLATAPDYWMRDDYRMEARILLEMLESLPTDRRTAPADARSDDKEQS